MTTRSGLRTLIRDELNDNASVKLWADALLNEYINQAIRAYSAELPEEVQGTIATVASQSDYTLPARLVRMLRVEYPTDTIRTLGERSAWSYRIFGNELILDPEPTVSAENILIEYVRSYAEPAVDGDTIATPAADDDILVRLVCAMALQQMSGDESKRMRFERQRGVSAMSMAGAYDRDARGRIAVRKRQVRTGWLSPTSSGTSSRPSENTDPGP